MSGCLAACGVSNARGCVGSGLGCSAQVSECLRRFGYVWCHGAREGGAADGVCFFVDQDKRACLRDVVVCVLNLGDIPPETGKG